MMKIMELCHTPTTWQRFFFFGSNKFGYIYSYVKHILCKSNTYFRAYIILLNCLIGKIG